MITYIDLKTSLKLNYTGSERMYFRLKGTNLDWTFNLGRHKASKSRINLNSKKFYDFQHTKKHFDDFKQNIILRILDGQIHIIHDQTGANYFLSEYVIHENILKADFKALKISGEKSPREWKIQPVEILSGHCRFSSAFILKFISYAYFKP